MTDDIAAVARSLTKVQRTICIESEPGAWGRADAAIGVELIGAGRWSAAKALVRKGLGDIEEYQCAYPPKLFFSNTAGLAVRAHLQNEAAMLEKDRG